MPSRGTLEIITHVNERRVESIDDLEDAMRDIGDGEVVLVQSILITEGGINDRPVFIRAQGGRR